MKQHSHLCSLETSAAVRRMHQYCTWRDLAEVLCYPPTYAPTLCNIAAGKPGQVTPEGEQELRKRLGLPYDIRHIVDVPADHDAALHLHPNGNGSLHTYTVPADAEVVIVPAGARVVQPKPASKPRRERTRLDVTRLVRAGWTKEEIDQVHAAMLEPIARHLIMAACYTSWEQRQDGVIASSHPSILHRVDAWLAEDAGTDPGEVAAVLARLE